MTHVEQKQNHYYDTISDSDNSSKTDENSNESMGYETFMTPFDKQLSISDKWMKFDNYTYHKIVIKGNKVQFCSFTNQQEIYQSFRKLDECQIVNDSQVSIQEGDIIYISNKETKHALKGVIGPPNKKKSPQHDYYFVPLKNLNPQSKADINRNRILRLVKKKRKKKKNYL